MRLFLPSFLIASTQAFLAPRSIHRANPSLHATGGRISVRPIGIGSSAPSTVLTNFDLETVHDTSDEWIRTRTGIEQRRVLVHDGTRKVVHEEGGEKAERETLRTLGIDGQFYFLLIMYDFSELELITRFILSSVVLANHK